MRTLYIDIETSPILADVWGLWNQNVALNQIHEPTQLLCYAYKWEGEPTRFRGINKAPLEEIVADAYTLLDEADAVVTWNGDDFDIPHLNREMMLVDLTPPSPYRSIDLYRLTKKRFKFPSNKLQYISAALGFKGKVSHGGHQLWQACIKGDAKAWRTMERYAKQDVDLLPQIRKRLGSWVDAPNLHLYDGGSGCVNCGSNELVREGYAYTALGKYQRFSCSACGKWMRSSKRVSGVEMQAAL